MLENEVGILLEEGIDDRSQYVSWVRKWKRVHHALVSRIVYLKQDTKKIGFSIRGTEDDLKELKAIDLMGHNQHNLHEHRKLAKFMYEARVAHKDSLKKGLFPQIELEMDGHNSRTVASITM